MVATRNPGAVDGDLDGQVLYGASPRASMGIDRAARAHAWLAGRDFVGPEDIQAVAPDVLRHRLVLSFEAEADGVDAESDHRRCSGWRWSALVARLDHITEGCIAGQCQPGRADPSRAARRAPSRSMCCASTRCRPARTSRTFAVAAWSLMNRVPISPATIRAASTGASRRAARRPTPSYFAKNANDRCWLLSICVQHALRDARLFQVGQRESCRRAARLGGAPSWRSSRWY